MKYVSKTHHLKSGTPINIRIPEVSEAKYLLALKRDYIKNTTTIPLKLDEYPNDLSKEEVIISEYSNSTNSILLVAELDGNLIGNIDLTGSKRSLMSHTAMIGMGISEAWRNQGLGRILLEAVIEWAKNASKLELIWLDVYASNELGLNLYKNIGFTESGTIKGFFKDASGYQDKVQMYMHI